MIINEKMRKAGDREGHYYHLKFEKILGNIFEAGDREDHYYHLKFEKILGNIFEFKFITDERWYFGHELKHEDFKKLTINNCYIVYFSRECVLHIICNTTRGFFYGLP